MEPASEIAVAFASALVIGDFDRAHNLLTPALRQQLSPEKLCEKLYGMFRLYATSEPKRIWFDDGSVMNWPLEFPTDVGSFYVGIEGDDFLEAVTVTVTDVGGQYLIRDIIWGRP